MSEQLEYLIEDLRIELKRQELDTLLDTEAETTDELAWIFHNKFYIPNWNIKETTVFSIVEKKIRVLVVFSNEDILIIRTMPDQDPAIFGAIELDNATPESVAFLIRTALKVK